MAPRGLGSEAHLAFGSVLTEARSSIYATHLLSWEGRALLHSVFLDSRVVSLSLDPKQILEPMGESCMLSL